MTCDERPSGLESGFRLARPQVDVYAFAFIVYGLFEGRKPFGQIHPIEAARKASMDGARPHWGKSNRYI